MRHIILNHPHESQYPLAILIKDTALKHKYLTQHIIEPAQITESCIGIGLPYEDTTQVRMAVCKEFYADALPQLIEIGVKYILCCDTGNYFKALTGVTKVEPYYGYVLPCKLKGFENSGLQIIGCPNYQSLIFNQTNQNKIDLALKALTTHMKNTYVALGTYVIHSEKYPQTASELAVALDKLHTYPMISADIETFSLKHYEAGIATIAFAWDKHNGFAACIDYDGLHLEKRKLLKQFFLQYRGTIIWHGASFDIKVLIYELWMEDLLDQKGLLEGLLVMTRNFHCTKLISYLATNNCSENRLGLKQQAHEFAGNYAQDNIKDITKIPQENLLRYNLIDCLSTWFVYKKNWPKVIQDNQENVYNTIFKPSQKTLIQTELTGNPLNMEQVLKTKEMLLEHQNKALEVLNSLDFIKDYFQDKVFNPNSSKQLQDLIYNHLGYEVIDLTKAQQPSTQAKTLKALNHVSKHKDHTLMFEALLVNSEVSILLNNFIKNFLLAPKAKDGWHYLFGNFNLGGTKSGRLSSSQVNLTNLPSGGNKYAKDIKKCFQPNTGWIIVGSDYSALEDVANTLLTKDPNKLKVMTDGLDGHSFRAYYFFPDKLTDIINTTESINSIKNKYPDIRQDAKAPAFALFYLGTWRTLVKNCGFTEDLAKQIETNFQKMYKVSIDWVNAKLDQAVQDGYVTLAYGLRLRTHILKDRPHSSFAATERRTAGNAVSGQSYCIMNSKSVNEFMEEVWSSDHSLDIKPIMQIHDSQYYLVKNDLNLITWLNERIPFHMTNQINDLPELAHDELGLRAELDVHYKGWHQPITLPNHASSDDIKRICDSKVIDYKLKE